VVQERQGKSPEAKRSYQEAARLCQESGMEVDPEIEEGLRRLGETESGQTLGNSLPRAG
jgi:hypothetical protein